MKHLSLILCASALAATLSAQHLPENTHCRIDSALMECTNWGRTDFQRIVFTYDAKDCLLEELMTARENDSEGKPLPWYPRRRTTYTPGAQGKPELAIFYDIDWETQDWTENGQTRYEYDAHGNCTKQEEFIHPWTDDGPLPELVVSTSYTYTYDAQDRLIEQEGAFYSEGLPNYQFKNVIEYGPYGITSDKNYNKDGGDWKESFETIYEYSNKGLLQLQINADIDEDGNLSYRSRSEYEYDEQDHLKLERFYYKQEYDAHPVLERTFYYTCDAKGRIVKEEVIWVDETEVSHRIEYAYDEHDDLVNMKQYQKDYDPVTWETLPYLVLHEEETYYYKCLGGSSLQQLHTQGKQHGCMMLNGKKVIVSGNKCFDLMGHIVK